MTGTERCVKLNIPYQAIGCCALWLVAAALMTWASITPGVGPASGWAIIIAGGAASWTAVIGVRAVVWNVATQALRKFDGMLERRQAGVIRAAAEEVLRQMELRELEQQVGRLVPRQSGQPQST